MFYTNSVILFLVPFSLRLLGKVEVPLGELLSNNEIERSYDLVDGKNNPTLVSKTTLKIEPLKLDCLFVCLLRVKANHSVYKNVKGRHTRPNKFSAYVNPDW